MNHALGVHGTHDPLLVGLSLTIAVLASYTALTIAGRLRSADRRGRWFWLSAGAVALGGGIWSMHFVAMLAFSLGMPIDYQVGLTVASLIAAIAVAGIALYVVGRAHGSWKSLLISGFFAGLGVATMHYMGMAAMRMDATISYDPLLFAVSIVIAVVAATAALWLAFNLEAAWHKVAAAFVMGAAIGGMHYTGMAATIYTPLAGSAMTAGSAISPYGLAFAIAAASIAIFGLGIAAALVDRRFTAQLERELIERRKVEAELREVNKNLHAAMDKLSTTERLATIGQIAATVGHELRNPLASIRNSMELVRTQTAGKQLGLERALDRIDRNTERCASIIADLLNFARKKELEREPTAVAAWLTDTLDEHTLPPQVRLERDLLASEEIPVDRQKLRQIVVNLVDNAAQAMMDPQWQPGEGRERRIIVRAESADQGVRLSIIDNGPGMPPEVLSRIFEPLFTTKTSGIGLGMPIVQQLVEMHQGTIAIDSTVGRGTTIRVWLPNEQALAARSSEAQPTGMAA
ncbi:MAG TPA: MHYT domain-containing protein [Candidatus Acidoferrum sp.]|nr:MHYT domain-containing protein [Candidatus Acidoferrum sp.]